MKNTSFLTPVVIYEGVDEEALTDRALSEL